MVLGLGLLDFGISSLLRTRSMGGCLCVGRERGKEGAGCDDGTSALIGNLRGRRSSAGCGGRLCCNVMREFASFVWDHPTQQLQRRLLCTKTASKSHIKMYQQMRMAGHRSVGVLSKKIWKYFNKIIRRTPPGGTSNFDQIAGKDIIAC